MASDGALPSAAADSLPENVTLRIVILAHGNRNEDDLYLVLHLDSTIGSLKERIQHSLTQQPLPESQRLIYHGRPLQDNNVTLRQVLRLDQNHNATTTPSHVLHLVIRDGQNPTSNAATGPRLHRALGGSVGQLPQTQPAPQPQITQIGQMPVNMLQHGLAPPIQTAQMLLHNQLHMMQHQMQHQLAVNNARQAHPPHLREGGTTSPPTSITSQGQGASATTQTPNLQTILDGQNQQHASDHHAIPQQPVPDVNPGQNPHAPRSTIQVQETVGPNGERIRTVINNGAMTFRIAGNGMPNPFERPASAPGLSPLAEQPPHIPEPTSQIPNQDPARLRSSIQGHHHGQTPMPNPVFPHGRHLQHYPPFMNFPIVPMHVFPSAMDSQAQPSGTMAWLLNSPSGPQGIVFAPGHGFFSTQRSEDLAQLPGSRDAVPAPTSTTNAASGAPTTRPVTGLPPGQTQLARVRARLNHQRGQAQPGQQAPVQPQNVEEHDLMNLVIQRGWLFLRLYMFIFVLSEAGTWRRFIMISLAVLVCLLPSQNPFTQVFAAVRRHLDALIGPPDLARRQEQQRQQAQTGQNQPAATGNDTQSRNATNASENRDNDVAQRANGANPAVPTPEDNARRLLREHRERNPNIIRETFYRVEQALALFLASLVPGVGERHVRAREEARRIIDEEQRRRQEEQQRAAEAQSTAQNAEGNEPKQDQPRETHTLSANTAGSTASSSAVETNSTGNSEGIRLRSADA